MFHLKSNPSSRAASHPGTHLRLVLGEVLLTVAALFAIAFIAWRTDAAPWSLSTRGSFSNSVLSSDSTLISPRAEPASKWIADLKDSDPTVRAYAAQTLGVTHATEATDALIAATFDANARVRAQATLALGQIGAIRAAERVRELDIVEGNTFVKTAASLANEQILKHAAAVLNVPRPSLRTLVTAENGIAYAVVSDQLYTANADGAWFYVARLPDTINDLAVGSDGALLFAATQSAGLFRSRDGGQTWEYLDFGANTPTRLIPTAIAVDPQKNTHAYIVLAVASADNADQLSSLGVSASEDGGETWLELENSPTWSVTRHIFIDRKAPQFLYGSADEGPWRYALPSSLAQPN